MQILGESARGRWLRENLPNLAEHACRFTSRSTWDYNCVGFAVGDYRWWQFEERDDYYWPPGVFRSHWAISYVDALKTAGFEECEGPDPEPGFEKIAVFHKGGVFKHVAIVASAAVWKSKLGEYEDIEHPADGMAAGVYGGVFAYLKRSMIRGGEPLPDEYRI